MSQQPTLPDDITQAVYSSAEYAGYGQNGGSTRSGDDMIFGDHAQRLLLRLSPDNSNGGLKGEFTVGIAT